MRKLLLFSVTIAAGFLVFLTLSFDQANATQKNFDKSDINEYLDYLEIQMEESPDIKESYESFLELDNDSKLEFLQLLSDTNLQEEINYYLKKPQQNTSTTETIVLKNGAVTISQTSHQTSEPLYSPFSQVKTDSRTTEVRILGVKTTTYTIAVNYQHNGSSATSINWSRESHTNINPGVIVIDDGTTHHISAGIAHATGYFREYMTAIPGVSRTTSIDIASRP